MRIIFRADASLQIGTGHVMRCLTLADAVRDRGAECLFLCRPHDGHLLELVAARGHEAIALPIRYGETISDIDPPPAHAHWLGTNWATDAEDSRSALASLPVSSKADWLVVDHYALDRRWETAMRPHCYRLLVIDDLADRPHDCDLLLDQNLGRRAVDYQHLLSPGAQMLIGPHYALLRPEFATLRAKSLARRKKPQLKQLLITMGGVDKDNATGTVLETLDGCDLPHDLRIIVVLGPHAPWLSHVQTRAARMRQPTRVLAGVSDMAQLMTDADLAIGAAGSASWERCCLGLPAIQLVLAENQRIVATALQEVEAAAIAKNVWNVTDLLQTKLSSKTMSEFLRTFSISAARITDGNGIARILHSITN